MITSNVLLCAYKHLSDGAKITYQVIDGYDWEDKETKTSKGYAFPATETLAEMRDTSIRSIERHIKELVEVKLLTRVRHRNRPSLLYIEDVSEAEIKNYLNKRENPKSKRFKNQPNQSCSGNLPTEFSTKREKEDRDTSTQSRNDKNDVSGKPSETTKMSFAYKKENEGKENKFNVNVENDNKSRRRGKPVAVGEVLQTYNMPPPARNNGKSTKRVKRDSLAEDLATKLNDQKSLGWFRVLATKIPPAVLYETLAKVNDATKVGNIRKRGAVYTKAIKDYAAKHQIELGFNTAPG